MPPHTRSPWGLKLAHFRDVASVSQGPCWSSFAPRAQQRPSSEKNLALHGTPPFPVLSLVFSGTDGILSNSRLLYWDLLAPKENYSEQSLGEHCFNTLWPPGIQLPPSLALYVEGAWCLRPSKEGRPAEDTSWKLFVRRPECESQLHDLRQVISPLCASVFLPAKWGLPNSPHCRLMMMPLEEAGTEAGAEQMLRQGLGNGR